MIAPEAASLARRLAFAVRSRSVLDAAASAVTRALRLDTRAAYQLVPDRLARIGFDAVESLRLGRIVPSLGDVIAVEAPPPAAQQPVQRAFWYDRSRHAMVGLLLGVDLIESEARMAVVDLNTGAAMRASRRELYGRSIDPLVTKMIDLVARQGFERLVILRGRWRPGDVDEWLGAGAARGVTVVPGSLPWMDHAARVPLYEIPESLEPGTAYIVFTHRYTPVDFFICDKVTNAGWMAATLSQHPALGTHIFVVPAPTTLSVPPVDPDPRWPNLVVKEAGQACGRSMVLARVETDAEATAALRMSSRTATPRALRRSLSDRMHGWVTPGGRVLYQPFVPPATTDGFARIVRTHVLVSPLAVGFLSAHFVVAGARVPDRCPRGLVTDIAPFVVNFSVGGHYALPGARDLARIADASEQICGLVRAGLTQHFQCGDTGES